MDTEKAKKKWDEMSLMDQQEYVSFEAYLKSRHWEKIDSKKSDDGDVLGLIGGILILILIVYFALEGFDYVSEFFDDRSSKKALCAEETSNVKNEFTAKKLYKACMNR
jgi:hypothetical protein